MSTQLPDFVEIQRRFESLPTGAKAELRRAAVPSELALVPGAYRLFPGNRLYPQHLRLAFLLPWCKHKTGAKSLGAQLADAKVSESRVLQMARDGSEQSSLAQLRRLAMFSEPSVNWERLGEFLWKWDRRWPQRRIVEDYYIALHKLDKGDKQ